MDLGDLGEEVLGFCSSKQNHKLLRAPIYCFQLMEKSGTGTKSILPAKRAFCPPQGGEEEKKREEKERKREGGGT